LRAVTFNRYGPPEVLRVADIERPTPETDEVLIRVHATTATRSDCGRRSAEYFVGRFFTGIFRPRKGTIGIEFAGEVETVGDAVSQFAVGDRLFGIAGATNAEYVCVKESAKVAAIPNGISFQEAAAAPDGALSAMSLLRGRVERGDRVLIYGASGSIGVGAVQIAKHFHAHVTAVCNTKNIDLMRMLGADKVIDYLEDDFAKARETYDLVLDAAGKTSFLHCRRVLESDGLYITTDPGFMWHDALTSLFSKRAKLGIVRYEKADILALAQLLEVGKYRPVIDLVYPLDDVVKAHRYVDTHQKTGSVVLMVS